VNPVWLQEPPQACQVSSYRESGFFPFSPRPKPLRRPLFHPVTSNSPNGVPPNKGSYRWGSGKFNRIFPIKPLLGKPAFKKPRIKTPLFGGGPGEETPRGFFAGKGGLPPLFFRARGGGGLLRGPHSFQKSLPEKSPPRRVRHTGVLPLLGENDKEGGS